MRLLQRLGGDRPDRLGQRVGGVVDDDVEPAEALDRARHQRPHLVEVAHVRGHAQGLGPGLLEHRHRPVARVGLAAGHHHLGAHGGEAPGDGEADAP